MRFLFITDHAYLPQRVGGTKSSTHDLCLSLKDRAHDVAVLAKLGEKDAIGLWHRALERLNATDGPSGDRVVGYPVCRARQLTPETIARAVTIHRPHLLVVQAERPSPVIDAARATGLPVIVYLRDVEFHKIASPLPIDRRTVYVANSSFTADGYRQRYGIDATVIPPLIRPDRYRCATDRSHITFVNPVPAKGSEIAFALAEARPDLRFLFVAGWPVSAADDTARQERAARLGNIRWQSPLFDMRRVYRRTRLLLAPSQWEEAWGRVVSEAQLSGIPVLASRRGGLPEAVGPGGMLVDHQAPLGSWAEALSAIVDDPICYARLSAAAAMHALRPDIAPHRLVGRFEAVAAGLVGGEAVRGTLFETAEPGVAAALHPARAAPS